MWCSRIWNKYHRRSNQSPYRRLLWHYSVRDYDLGHRCMYLRMNLRIWNRCEWYNLVRCMWVVSPSIHNHDPMQGVRNMWCSRIWNKYHKRSNLLKCMWVPVHRGERDYDPMLEWSNMWCSRSHYMCHIRCILNSYKWLLLRNGV